MPDEVEKLIELSRNHVMTPKEREEQMLSYVYGNQPDDQRLPMSEIRKHLGFPPDPSAD